MGVTEILCSFGLNLEGETSKEIHKSSQLEFLEKFLGDKFALSVEKPLTWFCYLMLNT